MKFALMSLRPSVFSILLAVLFAPVDTPAEEEPTEALAKRAKQSIVVIRSADREGRLSGTGTGFVVGRDGVIASNFHVIGANRAFSVELPDGRKLEPTHILAVDRVRDLALIKVDATNLVPLVLGDSDAAKPGQGIVTIGNPLGLDFSVGKGVIAATERAVDDVPMLQVAIPLEPGSSGSPVLDSASGKVLGVLGIKSGDAIGFAVPVNRLKPMIDNPRPVPMAAWKTIGALDPAEWTTLFGADWRQRAGRLVATGTGEGVGGRTLALAANKPPKTDKAPFELEVEVKLSDESGAAGLVFCADGENKHYGFYPTGGRLRLARFEGPTPFTWNIIATVASEAYRPGEWNRLRVRYKSGAITCSVNGALVIESDDKGLAPGKIGLCKFREPEAEFRRFRVARKLEDPAAFEATDAKLTALLEQDAGLDDLAELGPAGIGSIQRRATKLVEEAAALKALADQVHRRQVVNELRTLSEKKDFNLIEAALLIARLDNPELEIEPYLARVARIAKGIKKGKNESETLDAVLKHLFTTMSFHGSVGAYHHRSNSYLNEVLDDREGLPISLSVLFVDIAKRKGLEAQGVGVPRHFIAKVMIDGKEQLIDPFHDGKKITRKEAAKLAGFPLAEDDFTETKPKDILIRMLVNLLAGTEGEEDAPRMIGYLDALLVLDSEAAERRGMRAMLLASQQRFTEALKDLDHILAQHPDDFDLRTVRELRARIAAENTK